MFTEPLAEVEVTEGSAAKLQCRVTSQAEAAIEWFKDDEAIVPNERVKTRFDGELCTLRLMPSKLDDEGEYKCVARNEFGSASCSAELLVNEPNAKPEFTEKLKPVDVVEGDDAELRVCVTANPEPTVEWFRGSDKIEEDERHVMRGDPEEEVYTLTIKGVQPADAGSYKCVASNEEGKVSCKVAVAVKEELIPPEFAGDNGSTPVTSEEGGEVKVAVNLKGKPPPAVVWFKGDTKLKETSRVKMETNGDQCSLVIINLKPDDSDTYKCELKNKAGTAARMFVVTVTPKGL